MIIMSLLPRFKDNGEKWTTDAYNSSDGRTTINYLRELARKDRPLPAEEHGYTEGHDDDFNTIQSALEQATFADDKLLKYVFEELDRTYILGQGRDFTWRKELVLVVYKAFIDRHGRDYPADEDDKDVYDDDVNHLKK